MESSCGIAAQPALESLYENTAWPALMANERTAVSPAVNKGGTAGRGKDSLSVPLQQRKETGGFFAFIRKECINFPWIEYLVKRRIHYG